MSIPGVISREDAEREKRASRPRVSRLRIYGDVQNDRRLKTVSGISLMMVMV